MNSKQVLEELARSPIAYFSVGSLEHHGQHIPVGFDSLWVHKACLAASEITGGVVLPPTYWGTGPCVAGIENLPGSLLLGESVIVDLISSILDQLISQGYKTIIAVTGHNPAVLGKVISKAKDNCLKNRGDLADAAPGLLGLLASGASLDSLGLHGGNDLARRDHLAPQFFRRGVLVELVMPIRPRQQRI